MNIPRILLTAPGSGHGKTTVTMALLSALKKKGVEAASFKVGPDYIDPMFHKKILGLSCSNLDSYLLGKDKCISLLARNKRDFQVIEGVMGYYDGIGSSSVSSTYEMATITKSPVILVLSLKGMALSAAAIAMGMATFRQDANIKGVILNSVSEMMYHYYKNILEEHTSLKVYGYLPNMEDCKIGSRHLGLVTAQEIEELEHIIDKLGKTALNTIELEEIIALGKTAPDLEASEIKPEKIGDVNLAIARDKAFSFYYDDALRYLEELGVTLIPFSPLANEPIPKNAHGLYLGGGYPESYMEVLSENKRFLDSLKKAFNEKLPTIAECGGFMILHKAFLGEKTYPLAGIIPGTCEMTSKLQPFGYLELKGKKDAMLSKKDIGLRAHEFHYSKSTCPGDFYVGKKPQSTRGWVTAYASDYYYMGYPHFHLYGNPQGAKAFVKKMVEYKEGL